LDAQTPYRGEGNGRARISQAVRIAGRSYKCPDGRRFRLGRAWRLPPENQHQTPDRISPLVDMAKSEAALPVAGVLTGRATTLGDTKSDQAVLQPVSVITVPTENITANIGRILGVVVKANVNVAKKSPSLMTSATTAIGPARRQSRLRRRK